MEASNLTQTIACEVCPKIGLTAIANNLIKLSFTALAIYFLWKYLGRQIELIQIQKKEKIFLERIKALGEIQAKGINVDNIIKQSLSDILEENLKIEKPKENKTEVKQI